MIEVIEKESANNNELPCLIKGFTLVVIKHLQRQIHAEALSGLILF